MPPLSFIPETGDAGLQTRPTKKSRPGLSPGALLPKWERLQVANHHLHEGSASTTAAIVDHGLFMHGLPMSAIAESRRLWYTICRITAG